MAKLNEGDVIEGIFTIALGLYIAYGTVEKNKLNQIRTKIDTKMFSSGRFKYDIIKNHKRQRGKNPPDFFNVAFEMRLKPESVQGAFGKEYNVLYESSKDVGDIDKKIDQLINSVEKSSFSRKVNAAIDKFIENNVSEIITFTVIADGIAGESSGGEIKGDVKLDIYAAAKGGNKKISTGAIPFSLKSQSVTVANLSPYYGMLDFAKAVGIEWNAKEKYDRLTQRFSGPVEQAAKFELIKAMYDDLKSKMIIQSKKPSFTDSAMHFLGKSIFGSDLADVIDIQSSAVKEITLDYFNQLRKTVTLIVKPNGNNLVFVDEKTGNKIFQIRTKLLPPPRNEAKFYLEVGKDIYSK